MTSSFASACNTDTTPNQPHRNSNTHRTKNNTTNVVIQQNSRKLLMMDILMSETCWAHKWNKIASDIKLVSYSSTITMMHGPIHIRKDLPSCLQRLVYSTHETNALPDIWTPEFSTITELRRLCCSTNIVLVVNPRTITQTARVTPVHKFQPATSDNAELVPWREWHRIESQILIAPSRTAISQSV